MNLAVLSVAALALAIVVSCVTTLNVGVLAVALAWIIGVYIGGMPVNTVIARLPDAAVPDAGRHDAALLAGAVQRHARPARAPRRPRLPRQPRRRSRSCSSCSARRWPRWAPATSPPRRSSRRWRWRRPARVGIPLFLMAIMVGNGANAGVAVAVRADRHHRQRPHGAHRACRATRCRPISTTWRAHALVAFGGYFLFGGLKLFAQRPTAETVELRRRPTRGRHHVRARDTGSRSASSPRCILSVLIFFEVNVGMGAFVGAVVLVLPRCGRRWRGDQADAVAGDHDGVRRDGADRACSRRRRAST